MKRQKGTHIKLTKNNLFYLPRTVLDFKMSSNSLTLGSLKKWHSWLAHLNQIDVHHRTVGQLDDYATHAHWLRSQRSKYQEWHRTKQKRCWRGWSQLWWELSEKRHFRGSGSALCFQTSKRSLWLCTCLRQRVMHWPAWRNLFSVWRRPRRYGKTLRRSFCQSSWRCTA